MHYEFQYNYRKDRLTMHVFSVVDSNKVQSKIFFKMLQDLKPFQDGKCKTKRKLTIYCLSRIICRGYFNVIAKLNECLINQIM